LDGVRGSPGSYVALSASEAITRYAPYTLGAYVCDAITNVVLTSPEQFARENQQRVQRNGE
jgi:hypothetical protein